MASQTYIEANFEGEFVANAYRVSRGDEVGYEAFLTNQMNLSFNESGALAAVGEGSVLCDGMPRGGKGRRGHGPRGHGHHPPKDSTGERAHAEITFEELPELAQTYVTDNYPDSAILKVISVTKDDTTTFHIHVEFVGGLIFDEDGNFIALKEPRGKGCVQLEEVAIEDLPTAVTDYISENYPDAVVLGARQGTINDEAQIHVKLEDIGVLIFDSEGAFVQLKTCGMRE